MSFTCIYRAVNFKNQLKSWVHFTFDLKQSVSVLDTYKLEVIPPQKFKNDPERQQRQKSEDNVVLFATK